MEICCFNFDRRRQKRRTKEEPLQKQKPPNKSVGVYCIAKPINDDLTAPGAPAKTQNNVTQDAVAYAIIAHGSDGNTGNPVDTYDVPEDVKKDFADTDSAVVFEENELYSSFDASEENEK